MQYQLKRSKKAKKITIRVEAPDQVRVTAPRFTSKTIIDKFVNQQQNWILKQFKIQIKQQETIESKNHIHIFGKKFTKNYQFDPTLSTGVFIQNSQVLLNFPNNFNTRLIQKELNLFLKKSSLTYFKKRVPKLANKMNVEYKKLIFRQQKTRWGSCSSRKTLSFNWRLVHYAPKLIDYVIIHELAHLKHPNHSAQFWAFVGKYNPQYKQHRRQLKENEVSFFNLPNYSEHDLLQLEQ
jgi:hypothetical protein